MLLLCSAGDTNLPSRTRSAGTVAKTTGNFGRSCHCASRDAPGTRGRFPPAAPLRAPAEAPPALSDPACHHTNEVQGFKVSCIFNDMPQHAHPVLDLSSFKGGRSVCGAERCEGLHLEQVDADGIAILPCISITEQPAPRTHTASSAEQPWSQSCPARRRAENILRVTQTST